MTSDLFPDCRQDSPRLAWMKRHGINIDETEDGFYAKIGHIGHGFTKDEAVIDLAVKANIPLWNEEQFAKDFK